MSSTAIHRKTIMHGRQDNEVGVEYARCCGRPVAQCDCVWQARKKVLRQQVLGGNTVRPAPVQGKKVTGNRVVKVQNDARAKLPSLAKVGRIVVSSRKGPTMLGRIVPQVGRLRTARPCCGLPPDECRCDATRGLAGVVQNVFCKTGQGGGIDPTCKVGSGGGGGGTASSPARQSDGVHEEANPTGRRISLSSAKGVAEVWQGAGDEQWRVRVGPKESGEVLKVGSKEEGLSHARAALRVEGAQPAPQPNPQPKPPVQPDQPNQSKQQSGTPKTNDLDDGEKAAARAALARLPTDKTSSIGSAYNTEAVRVDHLGWTEAPGGLPWGAGDTASPKGEKLGRLGNVPLEGIKTSQDAIPARGLASYIERQPDPKKDGWPVVAKFPDGTYQIISGHTRLGAARLAGRSHGRAKVYQFDEQGNLVGLES